MKLYCFKCKKNMEVEDQKAALQHIANCGLKEAREQIDMSTEELESIKR